MHWCTQLFLHSTREKMKTINKPVSKNLVPHNFFKNKYRGGSSNIRTYDDAMGLSIGSFWKLIVEEWRDYYEWIQLASIDSFKLFKKAIICFMYCSRL